MTEILIVWIVVAAVLWLFAMRDRGARRDWLAIACMCLGWPLLVPWVLRDVWRAWRGVWR